MGRPLRFIPDGKLVEVTTRTIQSRLLLRPSKRLNELILGVIGRALFLYDVELIAFAAMSNHIHYLLVPADAEQLAKFMAYVNRKISIEAGHENDWKGPLWGRRYRAIVIWDEETQIERLRYLFQHGCKENFVSNPTSWPGASSVMAMITGTALEGIWVDRTRLYRASRRKKNKPGPKDFETRYSIELAPLPCWAHLSPEQHRQECVAMVAAIVQQTALDNARSKRKVMGADWVLRQDPHSQPRKTKKSPAPMVHAACKAARDGFWKKYRAFVNAYRRAADRLRRGELAVEFPVGSFPPPRPFVMLA